MLLKKIKNKVRLILGLKKPVKPRYPFIWHQTEFDLSFKINNSIEEFRLKDWGGERQYVLEMMGELSDNDVFFDIGSSVGLMSVIAARVLKKGQVVSFEPDPENLRCLRENYRINHLSNFIIQNLAVGDKKDRMKLFTGGSNNFSPSLQQVNGISSFIEVEVNTIDNLLNERKVPVPTVVKIDIEGAEMIALRGMDGLLTGGNRPRIIFMEVHPEFLPSFNTSGEEILAYLSQLDYHIAKEEVRDKQVLYKLVRRD